MCFAVFMCVRCRALVEPSGELKAEQLILQPVNVNVTVLRNLSISWYHGHPDFEVDGKMDSFKVSAWRD